MKFLYSVSCIFIFLLISSCNLFISPEPVPSYIHIEKIDLTTTSQQGTNSHKITDAWVYIDDQLIGCFELPATFPALFDGVHQLKIGAGIKVNGIAATRTPYPFYTYYNQSIALQKGSIVDVSPTVAYTSFAQFDFMEDFEGSGIAIDSSAGSNTVIQRIYSATENPNVFEGNQSGVAYIDKTHGFFECVSSQTFTLAKGGSNIFLEMNYKSEHEFLVGVIAQPPYYLKTTALTLNPTSVWKKTYIYLTNAVSSSPNATQFKIFIGMINNTNSDSTTLLLDNIKLVHL